MFKMVGHVFRHPISGLVRRYETMTNTHIYKERGRPKKDLINNDKRG